MLPPTIPLDATPSSLRSDGHRALAAAAVIAQRDLEEAMRLRDLAECLFDAARKLSDAR